MLLPCSQRAPTPLAGVVQSRLRGPRGRLFQVFKIVKRLREVGELERRHRPIWRRSCNASSARSSRPRPLRAPTSASGTTSNDRPPPPGTPTTRQRWTGPWRASPSSTSVTSPTRCCGTRRGARASRPPTPPAWTPTPQKNKKKILNVNRPKPSDRHAAGAPARWERVRAEAKAARAESDAHRAADAAHRSATKAAAAEKVRRACHAGACGQRRH